jgi:hypothetical protein
MYATMECHGYHIIHRKGERVEVSWFIMLLHLQSGLVSRKKVDTALKSRRFSLR